MPYLGNEPATAYTSTTKDSFSGDGSTTTFTMSKAASVNAVRVVVENVIQDPTVAYTCSGTTLTFTSAPPSGTNNIYVVHLGPPAATVAPPTTINSNTTFMDGLTLKNGSPEDTDGGRESIVTFKGLQSGQEESTLAQIQAAHDGSSDDEKGLISFKTNDGNDSNSPTERWRITSDGHFKAMSNGLGIDFSATEGSDASSSILDDYEEGTWTPTSSGGGHTIGSINTARYTKIGQNVNVQCYVTFNAGSGNSGQFAIGGLPYTAASGAFAATKSDSGSGGKTGHYCRADSASTEVTFYHDANAVNSTRQQLAGNEVGSTSSAFYVIFNITYITDL